MKKLITILAITSLFSFQAFAQLASDACGIDLPTCQSFQLGSEAYVLHDFSVLEVKAISIGKVRPGETVEVDFLTDGHRGKSTGEITVVAEVETSYTISCNASLSTISFQGDVSTALTSCELQNQITDDQASSISGEVVNDAAGGMNFYNIYLALNVPSGAQAGDASGSVHLELAYE